MAVCRSSSLRTPWREKALTAAAHQLYPLRWASLHIVRGRSLNDEAPNPVPFDVAAARTGDRAACRRLYDTHIDAVFGFCLRFCRGDRATASDLSQDAFAAAWSHLDDLRELDRFSGWLMMITRRTCLQWASRRRREKQALTDLHAEPNPRSTDRERSAKVVAEVVAACPDPALREAAQLFYIDPGHTTDAIAEQLGMSRTAVTTRLYRFRAWAKKRMLGRLADALEEAP